MEENAQCTCNVVEENACSLCSVMYICTYVYMCIGDCWHLRKTDWSGEEADILEDEVRVYIHVHKLERPCIYIRTYVCMYV